MSTPFDMAMSKARHQGYQTMFLSVILVVLKLTDVYADGTQCPVLILPEHGFFFFGYCEREAGSLCGLGCLTGYRLVNGDSFRECREDGTWTGDQLKCEEIRCPPLKTHSRVIQECSLEHNTMDFRFGTKCRARCNETGYRLFGPRTRECLVLGIWSGYEQFCAVGEESTASLIITTTSTQSSTIAAEKYYDYSNYALSIHQNDTGITLSSFPASAFTIMFWFYLENTPNTALISLREVNDTKQFEILVRQNKLIFHHSSRNQTQPTLIQISSLKWNHFAWMYSNKTRQSYLYLNGARQQSFDFGITKLNFQNVTSLILFGRAFHGLVTRLEIWKEVISEQQLLVSYRDCRKQNGNLFSWSKVSEDILVDTTKLKSSAFCSGCSEPASIHGGKYYVSGYEVGSSVEYKCDDGYEMIGANRAHCMVPSEWYPVPPICKYNPCTSDCELCDKKTGVCLRKQPRFDLDICDPPCEEEEECIEGECVWWNRGSTQNSITNENVCNPPCPAGVRCVNRQCETKLMPFCSVSCRAGQVCVDGRCGCYKGLCENGRACYETCETGERCFNWSCSCGLQGKCGKGEVCQSDICRCGTQRDGCRPHEHCLNGRCICKTSVCDQCDNACKSNEICLDGKCVCKEQCEKAFCPFPCLNGGRCSGFYQCTCRQGWQGHRCEQRQRQN